MRDSSFRYENIQSVVAVVAVVPLLIDASITVYPMDLVGIFSSLSLSSSSSAQVDRSVGRSLSLACVLHCYLFIDLIRFFTCIFSFS